MHDSALQALESYREDKRKEAFAEKYYCPEDYKAYRAGIEFIESAVAALPDKERAVIEALYFEGLTWTAASIKLYISQNTLNRTRKRGIEKIFEMFESLKFDKTG